MLVPWAEAYTYRANEMKGGLLRYRISGEFDHSFKERKLMLEFTRLTYTLFFLLTVTFVMWRPRKGNKRGLFLQQLELF